MRWNISAALKRLSPTTFAPAGFDGVVCGHIHHAAIKTIGGVVYHNDGDWVESCTALVEDARGHLEILRWADAGLRPLTVPAGHAADELADAIPA